MHTKEPSRPHQFNKLLNNVQEAIFIRWHGAVRNRKTYKFNSYCLAFLQLSMEPKFLGFFLGEFI